MQLDVGLPSWYSLMVLSVINLRVFGQTETASAPQRSGRFLSVCYNAPAALGKRRRVVRPRRPHPGWRCRQPGVSRTACTPAAARFVRALPGVAQQQATLSKAATGFSHALAGDVRRQAIILGNRHARVALVRRAAEAKAAAVGSGQIRQNIALPNSAPPAPQELLRRTRQLVGGGVHQQLADLDL